MIKSGGPFVAVLIFGSYYQSATQKLYALLHLAVLMGSCQKIWSILHMYLWILAVAFLGIY